MATYILNVRRRAGSDNYLHPGACFHLAGHSAGQNGQIAFTWYLSNAWETLRTSAEKIALPISFQPESRSGETGALSAGSPDRAKSPSTRRRPAGRRHPVRPTPCAFRLALRALPAALRSFSVSQLRLNFPPADTSGTPKNLIPGKLGSKSSKPSKLGGPMGVNSGILHL